MGKSLGNKVLTAIRNTRKTITRQEGEKDYQFATRFEQALQAALGLKVLAQTDVSSKDSYPRLNVTVWSAKGREIKNPNLKHSRRVNYFYA